LQGSAGESSSRHRGPSYYYITFYREITLMGEGTAMPYSLQEGEELVRTARYVVESFASSVRFSRWIAEERLARYTPRHGVFVTIEHYPTRTLRGCIGFPTALKPMKELLVDAAISAASEDPRFVPVSHMELEHIVVEVNVLSEPVRIASRSPEGIKRQIKVGRDGLIIRHGYDGGLLLPIVAIENKWKTEEFLEQVCIKAGFPPNRWKGPGVTLEKFTSQVFRERSPRGRVEEIVLGQTRQVQE
jgi:uncharacterized protein